jgi:hypothetical protein
MYADDRVSILPVPESLKARPVDSPQLPEPSYNAEKVAKSPRGSRVNPYQE